MATITCRDCGFQRHRVPANTRYCKRCRLLRDIDYWRRRTRTCSCGAVFAPLGRLDRHCSKCDPGLRAHTGPCGLGNHDGRYVHPSLPICASCCRDPKQRQRMIAALERGQAARRRENNHPEEATRG